MSPCTENNIDLQHLFPTLTLSLYPILMQNNFFFFLSKSVFLYLHLFLVQITYQFQRASSSGWRLLKIKIRASGGRVFIGEAPPQSRLC